MNSFSLLFTQPKNDMVILDMASLELSRLKNRSLMASVIILLKTEKNTYVLTCDEGNGQLNVVWVVGHYL